MDLPILPFHLTKVRGHCSFCNTCPSHSTLLQELDINVQEAQRSLCWSHCVAAALEGFVPAVVCLLATGFEPGGLLPSQVVAPVHQAASSPAGVEKGES